MGSTASIHRARQWTTTRSTDGVRSTLRAAPADCRKHPPARSADFDGWDVGMTLAHSQCLEATPRAEVVMPHASGRTRRCAQWPAAPPGGWMQSDATHTVSFTVLSPTGICCGTNMKAGKMGLAVGPAAVAPESETAGRGSDRSSPPATAFFMAFSPY